MWDETHWKGVHNKKHSWIKRGNYPGRSYGKRINNLTMFYALTSDGRQYWKFLEGTNNSWVTIHWLMSLHVALLNDNPNYRDTHVVIEDNASPHVSQVTMTFKRLIQMRICQTASASFDALPVEGCFRTLKAKVNYQDKMVVDMDKRLIMSEKATFNERFSGYVCIQVLNLTPEVLKHIESKKFVNLHNLLDVDIIWPVTSIGGVNWPMHLNSR